MDKQDRIIDGIRRDKGKADQALKDATASVAASQATEKRVQGDLDATQTKERENQRSIEKYEARRTSAQRVLEGGGGDPEAAERQVASVTDILDNLETEVLESMERIETLEAALANAKRGVLDAQAHETAEKAKHPETIKALKSAYAAATMNRETAWEQLDHTLREKYTATRSRKGRAIAEIIGGACKACQRVLQPQHVADLNRGLIKACRGCGRWLVFVED